MTDPVAQLEAEIARAREAMVAVMMSTVVMGAAGLMAAQQACHFAIPPMAKAAVLANVEIGVAG